MAVGPQVYWDDVREGDDIPGFVLPLTETQIVLQVSGTQDFYPVHHDRAFAREAGHPDIFVNTGFTLACLGRLLTTWIGDDGFLNKFSMQMRRMNRPGDEMAVKGRVAGKFVDESGDHRVECEVWAENQREGRTTVASATVTLPKRSA